jgi:hypothetical protein
VLRLLLTLALISCTAPAAAVVESASPSPTATASPPPTPVPTVDCSGPVPVFPCNYKSPIPSAPITCSAGATTFCYPRLGIDGPIIDDASKGAVDPLLTIVRDTTYASALAISAHGYTSFGNIAEWRAGDAILVYGRQYLVFDAFTVPCGQHINLTPDQASAKVFLQTSLNSEPCESGKHLDLFVLAR